MIVRNKDKSIVLYGNSLYDYDRLKEALNVAVID